jgi:hypothetical protein
MHYPSCYSCGVLEPSSILLLKRVTLVSDRQYLFNRYTLFMTFGYLWTLYVRVCGINDPGHTCDEYMVLVPKLSMTEPRGSNLLTVSCWWGSLPGTESASHLEVEGLEQLKKGRWGRRTTTFSTIAFKALSSALDSVSRSRVSNILIKIQDLDGTGEGSLLYSFCVSQAFSLL